LARGQPVDRAYIEQFFSPHRGDIRGDVLEICDNHYTLRFGEGRSYETVRRWVIHFGPMIAADLRKRRPKPYGSVRNLVRRAGWEPSSTLMQVLDAKIASRSAI
jgi:hypothetical protein